MVEALCLAGCWKVPVHGGFGDITKNSPTIAAWLVCRGWRDALRGSAVHLAAALIAAHGPEQALVRAVRCKSAHTQPLALVQEVLRQCGPHLPCLEPAFIEVRGRRLGRQGRLPATSQVFHCIRCARQAAKDLQKRTRCVVMLCVHTLCRLASGASMTSCGCCCSSLVT